MVEGGGADVDNLLAQGAEDIELEDERGEAGEGEDDDVELDEAQEWAGHGGRAAEGAADGDGEIDEQCGRVEPETLHRPERKCDREGAECQQAVDAPPGAGGIADQCAEGKGE